MEKYRLTVGKSSCDIVGFNNVHIQCAIDHVASLGGGEVELSEGTFIMKDSLHLRSNITVRGQGENTLLKKAPMKQAKIASYLGFGHYDIIVDHPDVFELGDGIIIGDDNAHGFYQTVGTLIRKEGDVWFTSDRHVHDYNRARNGFVKTLFPIISAVDIEDATAEGMTINGNQSENEAINGCRAGGFFAHRSNRIIVRAILVKDFKGEGFSFQTCDDLELDGCVADKCSGNGFHPGSGSNRFHIHDCTAKECGACGLFYCLAVRDGILETSVFINNGQQGVSIGGRDTGHINRNLTIKNNGGAGILLRAGASDIAAHNNIIENCVLENNCESCDEAEIVLDGQTRGIRIIQNTIRRRAGKAGILILPDMETFEEKDNNIIPAGDDAIIDRRK